MLDQALDRLRRTAFFTACIDFARKTLPPPVLIWLRSQMVRNLKGTPRDVFTEIYRRNIWGYQETVSGGGSTLHYTEQGAANPSRPSSPISRSARMLDLPCGDFQLVVRNRASCRRITSDADIVPHLVQATRIRYGRPGPRVPHASISAMTRCRTADLLLCRDCFIHSVGRHDRASRIDNILRSNVKYLADHHLSRRTRTARFTAATGSR